MTKPRGRPRHPDVLTPAEWDAVDAVRHGMSYADHARRRGVSRDAVKALVVSARDKLGLADRDAVRAWNGIPADSALAGARATARRTVVDDAVADATTGGGLRLGPIGQVARHVRDTATAVAWYRDVLGLAHLFTAGDLAFFDCDGVRLFLSPFEGSGGEPSILYFRVPGIHAAVDELTSRGVVFEGAPHRIFTHPDGTEEWMAFFRDPDGHLLAVMSQVAPSTS